MECQEFGWITVKGSGQRRKRRNRQPECASSTEAPRADDPKAGARTKNRAIPTPSSQTSMDTQAWEPREATARSTDGGFILHLIQRSFGIGSILIRLELVTQSFNSDSFCGLMVSQYGAVFVSLRVGICP